MGKNAKEHRKKVQKRNARIKQMQTSLNKKFQKMFTEKLEEYKKEMDSNKKSETTQEMFEPEVDSAGFTHEDNFNDIIEIEPNK